MKRSLHRLLTVMLVSMAAVSSAFAATSQTFFRPRSISEDAGLEMAISNYRLYHSKHDNMEYKRPTDRATVNFHKTYFYQESTNDTDLAKYFLLGDKTELRVADYNPVGLTATSTRDIHASWLDIESNTQQFQATFSVRPERKVWGGIAKTNLDMSKLLKGLWVEATLPIIGVEHNLNYTETNTFVTADFTANPAHTTISSALNNTAWLYGKWSTAKRRWAGVDDMQLKLGWNPFRGEKFHWGMYFDSLVPLGVRPSGEYVFEPIVGGVNWGAGFGSNLDWQFAGSEKNRFSWQVDGKYRYLFSDEERRTMDLTSGAFTRYLQFYKQRTDTNAAVPGAIYGVNVLTRDVKVTPGSRVDLMTSLHYKHSSFHLEAGYNFWWKDAEDVKLIKAFDDRIGVVGNAALTASANNAVITDGVQVAPATGGYDADFAAITASDLDLGSAAHDSAKTHKIFGGIALDYKTKKAPATIGFGGSYEWADSNTALENWAIWSKMLVMF